VKIITALVKYFSPNVPQAGDGRCPVCSGSGRHGKYPCGACGGSGNGVCS